MFTINAELSRPVVPQKPVWREQTERIQRNKDLMRKTVQLAGGVSLFGVVLLPFNWLIGIPFILLPIPLWFGLLGAKLGMIELTEMTPEEYKLRYERILKNWERNVSNLKPRKKPSFQQMIIGWVVMFMPTLIIPFFPGFGVDPTQSTIAMLIGGISLAVSGWLVGYEFSILVLFCGVYFNSVLATLLFIQAPLYFSAFAVASMTTSLFIMDLIAQAITLGARQLDKWLFPA